MNFKEHTEYKILSWEEIILLVDIIVPKVHTFIPDVKQLVPNAIKPISQNAIIPAALLADRLGVTVDLNKGYTFDLTDVHSPDICLFRVDTERYVNTSIYADITYKEQKLIFPWKSK